MKKKTIALLLALVMALSLLAGCGGNNNQTPSTPDTPKTDTPATPDPAPTPDPEPTPEPEPTTPGGDLPRTETLYFGGQQWGEVNSWNPVGANQNNAMAIASSRLAILLILFIRLFPFCFFMLFFFFLLFPSLPAPFTASHIFFPSGPPSLHVVDSPVLAR